MTQLVIVCLLAAAPLAAQDTPDPKPVLTPFFVTEPTAQGPAFYVECLNTTSSVISSGSDVWPLSKTAIRLDGKVLIDEGGRIGPGLTTDVPPGGKWRGILQLRQSATGSFPAVAFGALVRAGMLVPLTPGEHTIAVRCGAAWSDSLRFYFESSKEPVAPLEGTFSIVARDPAAGELGMAVQSKALATGSRTITIKGGVAAIAHQSSSNPMYGTVGLELLAAGMSPQQALDQMVRGDEGRATRQVAIIDATGRTAAWTGTEALEWKGHQCGRDFCAQGNILTGPDVVQAMAKSFESSTGPLAERLIAALDAGQAAGGDARGMQAAALVIAKPLAGAAGFGDRVIDLRVDDHRTPLSELRRLLNLTRSRRFVGEAQARLAAKNIAGAAESALAAKDMSPGNDEAWVVFAATELAVGRKASALDALRRAVELNPANARQLPKNRDLEPLFADPEFKKIVGGGRLN